MKHYLTKNTHFTLALCVLLINILLFVFIIKFHRIIPFSFSDYNLNAHHYIEDNRISDKGFSLINAIAVFDAQWYMKTAQDGYPFRPTFDQISDHQHMDGPRYGFYPLYPISLGVVNKIFNNIELSGFLYANILMMVTTLSIYYVVTKLFNKNIAIKTTILLFLFPFGIFFRTYYAEGLYLLILVWLGYFLVKKNFFLAAVLLSLLNITKGNGLFINIYFFFVIINDWRHKRINIGRGTIYLIVASLGLISWMIYCYHQTGSPFYFMDIQKSWYPNGLPLVAPLYNLLLIINFPQFPLHSIHFSQIDILIALVSLFIIVKARKIMPKPLWWISLILWGTPLLIRDFAAFSRFQSVSYPLFIYLAHQTRQKQFYSLVMLFTLGLLIASLFLANWYWVG